MLYLETITVLVIRLILSPAKTVFLHYALKWGIETQYGTGETAQAQECEDLSAGAVPSFTNWVALDSVG